MPRGLIFGYVVGLKLALNAYLINIGIGPNLDPHDPQKGSKRIGHVCALYTLSQCDFWCDFWHQGVNFQRAIIFLI